MKKGLVLFCLLALAVPMLADEIQFATATTTGCFYSTTACSPLLTTASDHGLNFTGAALPSSPATYTSGGTLEILLGNFTFTGSDPYNFTRNGVNFAAEVEFTLPEKITGGTNPTNYVAEVTGQVNSQANGNLTVNFDNTPLTFYFGDTSYTGSFEFALLDAKLNLNNPTGSNNGYWYGQITNASQTAVGSSPDPLPVPEPASLFLMGSGLVALAGMLRRKP